MTEQDIKKMKRGELNEYASTLGLNPEEYRRADDLKTAIFKHLKEQKKAESEQKAAQAKEAETKPKTKAAKPAKKDAADEEKKKGPKPKVRPRIERRGKKYRELAKKREKGKLYPVDEAVKLAQETSTTSFDATVELHIKLNVDPKQADQNIRGSTVLPHGTGKPLTVAVYVDEGDQDKAKKAGADIVDAVKLEKQLSNGELNFDVLITTPQQMSKISKFAKMLGPKGLMPNPKSGTVTANVEKAVKDAKSGKVEFRVDKYGIIHNSVGKVSFKAGDIAENIKSMLRAVFEARPTSVVKMDYIKSVYVTTSMGPSVAINPVDPRQDE